MPAPITATSACWVFILVLFPLDDALLGIRFVVHDAPPAEPCEVERLEATMQDELGDGAACRRCVHQAVPREAGGEIEVLALALPRPDDRIAVEIVLVVEARQGVLALRLLKLWEAMRQRRSHDVIEVIEIGR